MTCQHFPKAAAFAFLGTFALTLASQAWASGVISPEEADALVRAQIEEVQAAAAAQKEEEEAIRLEEAAEAEKIAKSGKKAKTGGEAKEISAAVKSQAVAFVAAAQKAVEKDAAEKSAALPVGLPVRSRSERADAAKAGALKPLITRYASENDLPYELADAVVRLESRYNPGARNGPNLGLTQINFRTAQSLGYKGDAAGLMDAETNLRYGLKYLAQAYRLAGGDTCGTILRYQFGHRTTAMTGASRAYCAKVKVITAAAE